MRRLEVLIDMDNTMVDLTTKFLQLYNAATGENSQHHEITNYDFAPACKDKKWIQKIVCTKGFFSDLEPFPGAVYYFKKIINMEDVNTTIVTQPSQKTEQAIIEKRRWMAETFPEFNLNNIIFTHKKYLLSGDVFFDDAPHHLVQWKERYGSSGITCKINFLYNKDTVTDYSFQQETAWKEFYELILKLRNDEIVA